MYSFIVTGGCSFWEIDDISYDYYIVDFSVGFCSKLLPGAIYNLFAREINNYSVTKYVTFLLICCFLLISYILECFLNKINCKDRKEVLILIFFYLSGPYTFAAHVEQFGMLDFHWLITAIFFVLFLSNKWSYILIIPLCLVAVSINFSAIFCFVPFFIVLMLYKVSVLKNGKEKIYLTSITFVSCLFSLALSFYFVFFERYNLNYTIDEFHDFLISRGSNYGLYYEYSFYRDTIGHLPQNFGVEIKINGNSFLEKLFGVVVQQLSVTFKMISWDDFANIIILLPLLILFFDFFKNLIKINKGNLLKKTIYLCMISIFFVPLIGCVLFSTDINRWVSHSFLLFFTCVFYCVYLEKESACLCLKQSVSKISLVHVFLYFVLYTIATAQTYSSISIST